MNSATAPSTGVRWYEEQPQLDLGNGTWAPLPPGTRTGVRVAGWRRCIGWHQPGSGRRACAFDAEIGVDATDVQCPACAGVDPGRRLARDAAVDHRTFHAYLATFGGAEVKIGITAAERGSARLREQGAVAWTFLARGPMTAIRSLELAVSGSGLATERVRAARKTELWWRLDPLRGRALLRDAATAVIDSVPAPPGVAWTPVNIVEHFGLFGLDGDLPPVARRLESVAAGSVLSGRIIVAAGGTVLLDTADGPVIAELKRLAGWELAGTDAPRTGLRLGPARRLAADPTLF